ncbi:hypothetical protein E2C01_002110 [Portunus trituberculatus]|uniref:Uncharacterized protein n=1 Tax=Portunus trituberculatus TaxID=210409 RepID=A0A5B7CMA2_PORTR|nr:hypothetical protein [Portunus trituberculatus]
MGNSSSRAAMRGVLDCIPDRILNYTTYGATPKTNAQVGLFTGLVLYLSLANHLVLHFEAPEI